MSCASGGRIDIAIDGKYRGYVTKDGKFATGTVTRGRYHMFYAEDFDKITRYVKALSEGVSSDELSLQKAELENLIIGLRKRPTTCLMSSMVPELRAKPGRPSYQSFLNGVNYRGSALDLDLGEKGVDAVSE